MINHKKLFEEKMNEGEPQAKRQKGTISIGFSFSKNLNAHFKLHEDKAIEDLIKNCYHGNIPRTAALYKKLHSLSPQYASPRFSDPIYTLEFNFSLVELANKTLFNEIVNTLEAQDSLHDSTVFIHSIVQDFKRNEAERISSRLDELVSFTLAMKKAVANISTSKHKKPTLFHLDDANLLSLVFSFFNFSTLVKFCLVCKFWYKVLSTSELSSIECSVPVAVKSMPYKLETTLPVIARLGHFISKLPAGLEVPYDYSEMFKWLPHLQEIDGRRACQAVIDSIAEHCKELKSISYENAFDAEPDSIFKNCKNLESICWSSDEGDIPTEGISTKSFEALAEGTSGNLQAIFMNAIVDGINMESIAKVIRKSPKLSSVDIQYDENNLEGYDPMNPNPIVAALQSHKKEYDNLAFNFLSKKDEKAINKLM